MEFYNGIVGFPITALTVFFVDLCLQTAVNHLSKSDKY